MTYPNPLSPHICVICWTGMEDRTRKIAAAVEPIAERITVIYSNRSNTPASGPGNWIQVPDEWYYGPKFSRWLAELDDESGLLIQADAECSNWPGLVESFVHAQTADAKLGVWVPKIEGTPFKPAYDDLWLARDKRFRHVGLVDGICWGFSRSVGKRLHNFDYSVNNLGWGVEFAAVAHAYAHGLSVLRSSEIEVFHEQGAGYNSAEAARQMGRFLGQLSNRERRWLAVLSFHHRVLAFTHIKMGQASNSSKLAAALLQPLLKSLAYFDIYPTEDRQ